MIPELPIFPYHRDPIDSGSVYKSDELCECCNKNRGVLYKGVTYSRNKPKNLCPWCIADGSALKKYDASFFDADFVDDNRNHIELPDKLYTEVFGKTIGFAAGGGTFYPGREIHF